MSRPREFWIVARHRDGWQYYVSDEEVKYKADENYHVIEKTAADSLAEALKVQDCKCGGEPYWICDRCHALKEYRGEK